jgi:cellobiose phosphorylase
VLNPDEHEAYEHPAVSDESGTLYEHCAAPSPSASPTGAHGLPLMGTGDWNDGMSLVGAEGRGESVWLASFIVSILRPFADLAAARGDVVDAVLYRDHTSRSRRDRRPRGTATGIAAPTSTTGRRLGRREHRVPDRRDRAVVVGARRHADPSRAPGAWRRSTSASSGATTGSRCC